MYLGLYQVAILEFYRWYVYHVADCMSTIKNFYAPFEISYFCCYLLAQCGALHVRIGILVYLYI